MGAKLPAAGGAPGAFSAAPVSDINVTPLVDVMLVLLIVFMVSAPLMTAGMKVDLPTSNAKPLTEPKPPVTVSLDAEGRVYVDKTEVTRDTLVPTVKAATEGDPERRIHVKGDRNLAYGKVIETMGWLADNGFGKVALVSEPPSAH
ncbi:ExbD/TolR family protein [Derxia gummosa]|uniref:ExbD/TolR family protein n=1 Tax=Derxia gummosa DSM 723 TaxID=1121388 RepID=A0A8B6X4B2_9BURK|nr:biopolymer transporter ExbD [Derxia gummosa]